LCPNPFFSLLSVLLFPFLYFIGEEREGNRKRPRKKGKEREQKEEDMICNVGLSPGGKDIISPGPWPLA